MSKAQDKEAALRILGQYIGCEIDMDQAAERLAVLIGKDRPQSHIQQGLPIKMEIEVWQTDSLADLIDKLPYGYCSRYEWAVLHTDLAKRDGQLEACGSLMSRDRKKIEELEGQIKLLQANCRLAEP